MTTKENKLVSYDDYAMKIYEKDPEMLAQLLQESLDEGEIEEFLRHLQMASKLFGGVSEIAKESGLHEKTLYKSLSPKGNPTIKTLLGVMNSLGLSLSIQAKNRNSKEVYN